MPDFSKRFARLFLAFSILFHGQVFASTVVLATETRVYIETMEELVAKGDRVTQGQLVASQVWRDVVIDGVVVVKAGTPVISRVDSVKRRQIAGVKGQMTIGAYETQSIDGQTIQLSGGYHKEGKSRMALSITLGVLLIIPIFIPGQAAELPSGTIFDAYVEKDWNIATAGISRVETIDLSYLEPDIEAELLYDKLAEEEKPKYFEFQITVPANAPREFVIDRINSEEIKPLKLKVLSAADVDDEAVITAQIKIKTLVKKFDKGINFIEIANAGTPERVSTRLMVDIEI
jgi:hypothetical protein